MYASATSWSRMCFLRVCPQRVRSWRVWNQHPKKGDGQPRNKSSWNLRSLRRYLTESLSVPLMVMYFIMLFLNTLLRDTKDTMLVTSDAGVEAIPLLKSWAVIPCSVAFFVVYSRLAGTLTRRQLFRTVMLGFVGFFVFFALVLYPSKHIITPSNLISKWREGASPQLRRILALLEEWPLGLFYVVAELWASVVCQLMFWQAANDVMSVKQAKSLYPIIGAMGNLGMVIGGRTLRSFADHRDLVASHAYLRISHPTTPTMETITPSPILLEPIDHDDSLSSAKAADTFIDAFNGDASFPTELSISPADQAWMTTLWMISILLVVSVATILWCYDSLYKRNAHLLMNGRGRSMSHDAEVHRVHEENKDRNNGSKPKVKLSMKQSLMTLRQSPALRCAAILVASYGVSISLVEVTWKGQVKHTFSKANDYARFMGSFWTWTGIASMLFMLLGRLTLQRMGYKAAVLFTPTVVCLAGGFFFTSSMLNGGDSNMFAAYSGGVAVLVAKAAKYAFFDATKEIIFIPLDRESQVVGKAAIDVVAYRLSKSGGSLVLQLVFVMSGSLVESSGLACTATVFAVVVFTWLRTAQVAGSIVEHVPVTVLAHGHVSRDGTVVQDRPNPGSPKQVHIEIENEKCDGADGYRSSTSISTPLSYSSISQSGDGYSFDSVKQGGE